MYIFVYNDISLHDFNILEPTGVQIVQKKYYFVFFIYIKKHKNK